MGDVTPVVSGPDDPAHADVGAAAAPGPELASRRERARPAPTLRQQRVEEAVDAWCGRLLELGGESALADITQLGAASIDLTAAHPSGIAQLFAGRQTLLSNLVREAAALASARRRARTVLARADELAQRFGVAPTYLAIGIASWTSIEPRSADAADPRPDVPQDGEVVTDGDVEPVTPGRDDEAPPAVTRRTVRAPILLRPVRLTPHSDSDVDVVLEPSVEVNPVLVRALRAAGSTLDTAELARETLTEYGFAPRSALRRLREEGEGALTGFRYAEHLVLGPFVHPGQVLVEDLEGRRRELAEHDVVAALAGDPEAASAVRRPLPPVVAADRDPAQERGVGDLDPSQQHAVDVVASGAHLFVDAPPGADVAATLAAIVADAAASGRHVLYVSGTRRAGQGLREATATAGLEGLLLDLSADSRWRAGAGARLGSGAAQGAPAVDEDVVRRRRGELMEVRARLSSYMSALHTPRPAWGVSAYDALQSLAALTAPDASPRTKVRLDAVTVRALSGDERGSVAATLTRAAELGAFALRPEDTPWFGAALTEPAQAQSVVDVVRRLGSRSLPELRRRIADIAGETGLQPADRLRSWADQLALLEGVRSALDVFLPQVFEAPIDDLVAATANREWRAANRVEMSSLTRRRLRHDARELVRPGRGFADLHRALVDVQAQRAAWRRHGAAGEPPRVPEGLWDAEEEYRAVLADLATLEPVLASTPGGGDLTGGLITDLEDRMNRLADGAGALRELPERTRILDRLRRRGLGALLADLAERDVPAQDVAAELDLAWWSSVFEQMLAADSALAGYDGEALGALADRLRELDVAQLGTLPGPILRAVADRRRSTLVASPPEVKALVRDLIGERVRDVRGAVASLGPIGGILRPCWMVAPMQVPQLLEAWQVVDLVVLDAAQHLPVEQAVSAISRAAQVVVVGDSRRTALNAEGAPQGVVDALAGVLPTVTLNADRVVREPALMAFLGEHGYADVIRPVPTPQTRSSLRLEVVDGFGMPVQGSGVVESVQAEVERVVDLVIEHALTRPGESLVVLTVSLRHADRVREAVRAAVADSPAVADFFAGDRPEPFAVLELDSAAGVRRDAVLLSLGLGKTPHGRVMHRFGRVSDPDGAGLLIDAIDACRRRLTVVSCFAPGELDRWRLRTPGPLLLVDLLEAAEAGGALAGSVPGEGQADQLLVDLAGRLRQRGLSVVPRYGVPGGVRIPLALGHPDHPDEMLLAVLTDDAEYAAQPSVRIRDRHEVQRLVDRGWGVHMAFSTAVFLDPQAEVENVLASVRRVLAARRARPLDLRPLPQATAVPPPVRPEVVGDGSAPPAPAATPDGRGEAPTAHETSPGVDAEFSAMAAQLAEMEAALQEMEAEFETDIPDDAAFGAQAVQDAGPRGVAGAENVEDSTEVVVVPVLDPADLAGESPEVATAEEEGLDIAGIDVTAAAARAQAVRDAVEGSSVASPEPVDLDLDMPHDLDPHGLDPHGLDTPRGER